MKEPDSPNQPNNTFGFWLCAGLLTILLASIMARDIDRPFYGLHSWKEAAAAWRARCYLKYDLAYTKGLALWEVGQPPNENPNRSLDHPQPDFLCRPSTSVHLLKNIQIIKPTDNPLSLHQPESTFFEKRDNMFMRQPVLFAVLQPPVTLVLVPPPC